METKKQLKDDNNEQIKNGKNLENETTTSAEEHDFSKFESQFNFTPQTVNALRANVGQQALENIKHIFQKTQTIREVADVKHQEIQAQFKELKERLNNSSECLTRMKKGIDNIKFSYQTKLFEMNRTLSPPGDSLDAVTQRPQTKEEMAQQMEEIRNKIDKIQKNIYTEKEKQEHVMRTYQDAFDNVSTVLENIDRGAYSSANIKPNDVNESE